jgi:DNA-binding FadR family transcriptional regulator
MSEQNPLPQASRRSLVETAIGLIRNQVETGSWKVGERIPKEAELAEMLRISRNTVREAVRVLSHAKMLEVRQGDGTYVRSNIDPSEIIRRVSHASLRDHLELRAILETEAARLAAIRRTDQDLETLKRLLRERGDVPEGDPGLFVDRDLAFHLGIARAAHNVALDELYRYFSATVRLSIQAVLADQDLAEPSNTAHRRIVAAIERQDADQAARAARDVVMPLIAKISDLIDS